MKIVMSIGLYSPFMGGAESQARLLSGGLRRRGVDVEVMTQLKAGLPPVETIDDVLVRRLPSPDLRPIGKYWHLVALDQAMRTSSWDIAHAHGAHGHAWVSVMAARALHRKSVVKFTNTGDRFDFNVLRRWFWPASRMIRDILQADRFLVMNEAMRAEAEQHGVPPEKITVVPNAVDARRFRPAEAGEKEALRKKFGFPDGFGVIFVGSLQKKKNPEILMEAFGRLAARRPSFLIVVGDGPLRSRLESGSKGPVFVLGPRPDVDELLRAADAFALPSSSEGQPNAMLEAMASGLACVGSDIAPHRELLGSETGLISPIEADALAAALDDLGSDGRKREALARAARARIEKDHEAGRVLDRLQAIYAELAGHG